MDPLLQAWLDKADSDYRTMRREHKVTDEPSLESVCYHAQQCCEKLLKAFLLANNIEFPKTHDLRRLIMLAIPIRPEWQTLIEPTSLLTRFAGNIRYPGESPLREESDEAVAICERVRTIILRELKDPDQLRLQ